MILIFCYEGIKIMNFEPFIKTIHKNTIVIGH